MIEEQAKVIAVEQGYVVVESLIKSSCSGCQQVDNCGSGQIAKAFPQKKVSYKVVTEQAMSPGDTVIIGLSEKLLLSAAWQVYLWPLIGLIAMGLLGQWLVEQLILPHELFAVLLSLAGGYLGFYLARRKQFSLSDSPQWSPSLVKILSVKSLARQISS
ncbi:sigma-E factor regulatory protein RseC [Thalassotalea insulae]|uniref:Sigma-E factor regulatory protein RseC n=1 Tax=Thalassotalea insulae TaxID=2056778 RepID=A0ABQ6GTZ6_9GAMM|nr:SoxR reducing system RseC family protein [Thalassotalea insulae]GLX79413.1 sigma-E factor regulatory protein RseC [Thalassotalea insulae]